jgi:hypothetical protein
MMIRKCENRFERQPFPVYWENSQITGIFLWPGNPEFLHFIFHGRGLESKNSGGTISSADAPACFSHTMVWEEDGLIIRYLLFLGLGLPDPETCHLTLTIDGR